MTPAEIDKKYTIKFFSLFNAFNRTHKNLEPIMLQAIETALHEKKKATPGTKADDPSRS